MLLQKLQPLKKKEIYGFECLVFPSEVEFLTWPRHRMKIAFYSTFFYRYWIMIVSNKEIAEKIRQDVIDLKIQNAGIAILAEKENKFRFQIIQAPTDLKPPQPDRTELYAASS